VPGLRREEVALLAGVSTDYYTRIETFNHPAVGEPNLTYEAVDLPTHDLRGLNLTIYTAQPGSTSEDQIKLLASWAATSNQSQADPEAVKSPRRSAAR
jgi:MmyB-like transcription regulator ligand binding domain